MRKYNSWPADGDQHELNTLQVLELCCQSWEWCVGTLSTAPVLTFHLQMTSDLMQDPSGIKISAKYQDHVTNSLLDGTNNITLIS